MFQTRRTFRHFPATRFLALAATAAVLLLAPPSARGQKTWIAPPATSGDWATAGNWSPSGPPGSRDNAIVSNAGTATISTTGDVCYDLYIGNNAGESGTVRIAIGREPRGHLDQRRLLRQRHLQSDRRNGKRGD